MLLNNLYFYYTTTQFSVVRWCENTSLLCVWKKVDRETIQRLFSLDNNTQEILVVNNKFVYAF